jgi:hypothetical protein
MIALAGGVIHSKIYESSASIGILGHPLQDNQARLNRRFGEVS